MSPMLKLTGALFGAALCISPSPGLAQDVSGRVWVAGSGQAAAGAVVTVSCAGTARSTTADQSGVYRLTAAGTGNCTVEVSYQNRASNRIAVQVARRVTVNLELAARGNGWAVTRR